MNGLLHEIHDETLVGDTCRQSSNTTGAPLYHGDYLSVHSLLIYRISMPADDDYSPPPDESFAIDEEDKDDRPGPLRRKSHKAGLPNGKSKGVSTLSE